MRNTIGLIILILALHWVWNNVISPPKWIGFYYPSASNLSNYEQSPELNSLEECRDWVDEASNGRTDTGFDYECGKDCKLSETGGIYICDETLE